MAFSSGCVIWWLRCSFDICCLWFYAGCFRLLILMLLGVLFVVFTLSGGGLFVIACLFSCGLGVLCMIWMCYMV